MLLILNGRIPSKKNSKRLVSVRGRVFPISSKAWMTFEKDALAQLKGQNTSPVGDPPYMVIVKFYNKSKMRTDIDNMLSGVFDLLQKAEIIEDDQQINSVQAFRSMGHDEFYTEIDIKHSNFKDNDEGRC